MFSGFSMRDRRKFDVAHFLGAETFVVKGVFRVSGYYEDTNREEVVS